MKFLTKKKLNKSTYLLLAISSCSVFTVKEKVEAVVRRSASLGNLGTSSSTSVTQSGLRRSNSSPAIVQSSVSSKLISSDASGGSDRFKYGFNASQFKPFDGLSPEKKYVQFLDKKGKLNTYEKSGINRLNLFLTQDELIREGRRIHRSRPRWVSGSDIIVSSKDKSQSGSGLGSGLSTSQPAAIGAIGNVQQGSTGGDGKPVMGLGDFIMKNPPPIKGGDDSSIGSTSTTQQTTGGTSTTSQTSGAAGGSSDKIGGATGGVQYNSIIRIFLKDGKVIKLPIDNGSTKYTSTTQQTTGGTSTTPQTSGAAGGSSDKTGGNVATMGLGDFIMKNPPPIKGGDDSSMGSTSTTQQITGGTSTTSQTSGATRVSSDEKKISNVPGNDKVMVKSSTTGKKEKVNIGGGSGTVTLTGEYTVSEDNKLRFAEKVVVGSSGQGKYLDIKSDSDADGVSLTTVEKNGFREDDPMKKVFARRVVIDSDSDDSDNGFKKVFARRVDLNSDIDSDYGGRKKLVGFRILGDESKGTSGSDKQLSVKYRRWRYEKTSGSEQSKVTGIDSDSDIDE